MKQTTLAYKVTLSSALSGSGGASCRAPKPTGTPITDWPDASWPYGCSTITVTGDPALSGTQAGYPASMPAEPGDLLSVDSGTYTHHELIRLLDKGPDGKTWYVQRRYYYGTMWPYSSVAAGGVLEMLSPAAYPDPNITGMQVWWDPDAGALNSNSANVYTDTLPQSHPAYINHP
jgi:hypothetical protein